MHFAYYRQRDGAYLYERLIPVAVPMRLALLPADRRPHVFNRWANRVARPRWGEVAIDVSRFDYPIGDFVWSVLRFGAGIEGRPLLDFPEERTFVQIEKQTGQLVAWTKAPRPVRSTADRWVIDVTGLAWEAAYGVFGRFVETGGRVAFLPELGRPALPEAAAELNPCELTTDRVVVEV